MRKSFPQMFHTLSRILINSSNVGVNTINHTIFDATQNSKNIFFNFPNTYLPTWKIRSINNSEMSAHKIASLFGSIEQLINTYPKWQENVLMTCSYAVDSKRLGGKKKKWWTRPLGFYYVACTLHTKWMLPLSFFLYPQEAEQMLRAKRSQLNEMIWFFFSALQKDAFDD